MRNRPLRLLSGGVMCVAAAVAAGCDLRCDPVTTSEKAFEISKREILKSERLMDKLKALGGDASIFEDSEVGEFNAVCDRPARFHFSRDLLEGAEFDVIWVGFVKGACEECWDTISMLTWVTHCGGFGTKLSFIRRKPNRSFIVLRPEEVPKGEDIVRYTHYCGPRRGMPLPGPKAN